MPSLFSDEFPAVMDDLAEAFGRAIRYESVVQGAVDASTGVAAETVSSFDVAALSRRGLVQRLVDAGVGGVTMEDGAYLVRASDLSGKRPRDGDRVVENSGLATETVRRVKRVETWGDGQAYVVVVSGLPKRAL